MLSNFLQGMALGFGSGVAPGPMFALVLAAALRGGFRNGAAVAMSPLVTDLPIVALSITVLAQLPASVVAKLAFVGAAVLAWNAYHAARDAFTVSLDDLRSSAEHAPSAGRSLRQGVITNFTNPSPWMFWMSIGGPLLTSAWSQSPASAAAFVLPFYVQLVGFKVLLAYAVGASRERISERTYRYTLLTAAGMLLALAISLVVRGLA